MRKELVGLDHLMIATTDLAAMRACYERLGFTVTPYRTNEPMGGGKTGGMGGNHLVLFQPTDDRMTNFLELAYADPAHAMPLMRDVLGRPTTLAMTVHAAADLEGLNTAWQQEGFPPFSTYELDTDYRDPVSGIVDRIHFRVLVPTALNGPLPFNACEVLDRSHYLRPDWIAHENSARHWAAVTVATSDLDVMRTHFNAVYGLKLSAGDEVTVTMGAQSLRVLDAPSFAAAYDGSGRRSDGSLADTAVTIAVESIDAARRVLQRHGVLVVDRGDSILVPAHEAGGLVLVFTTTAT